MKTIVNSVSTLMIRIGAVAMSLAGVFLSPLADAVPSMARQTGMPCAACHTVFPELTPFGRQFKLRGYAMNAPKGDVASILDKVPLSALLQVSRTSTKSVGTAGATQESFPRDRETIVQAAGLYYGGKITDKSGALVQYNYDGFGRNAKDNNSIFLLAWLLF